MFFFQFEIVRNVLVKLGPGANSVLVTRARGSLGPGAHSITLTPKTLGYFCIKHGD